MSEENKQQQQQQQQQDDRQVTMVPADRFNRLDQAHKTLQGELAGLKDQLSKYEGIDIQEYLAIKAQNEKLAADLAKKSPEAMEEYASRKIAEEKRRYEMELKKADERFNEVNRTVQTMSSRLKTLEVTDRVMAVIGKNFNTDVHEFIKGKVEAFCDKDADGNLYVKDADGNVMYSRVRRGEPMRLEEFGDMLAEQYPSLARSSVVNGTSDATGGNRTNRTGKKVTTWAELISRPDQKEIFASMTDEEVAALAKTM